MLPRPRLLLALTLTLCLLLTLSPDVRADEGKGEHHSSPPFLPVPYTTITSSGPLANIFLGNELSAQIDHATITGNQIYPPSTIPGDYGTFLYTGNVLYAPDFANHGVTATGSIGSYTAFTPVSQSAVTGSGTATNPYRLVTTVRAGSTGLTLTQTDSYIAGTESYQTDIRIANSTAVAQTALLYRAMDCYLGGSDSGFGAVDTATGSVGCTRNANNSPPGLIEQLIPITDGSRYYHASYSSVWTQIGNRQPFPNTCQCTTNLDNGMGLSWSITIPANGQITVSHITSFSPTGDQPVVVEKAADTRNTTAGGTNGYLITIRNLNATRTVTLTSITDVLPTGFSYILGSSGGLTTANPTISGQTLTWNGSFTIPAGGSVSLSFRVIVSSTPGTYYNTATASAGTLSVVPTGETAPIQVLPPQAVELESFEAAWQEDGILVTWTTAWELNSLGFHVWRGLGDEPETRLTADLIPSQSPGGGMGASYEWLDGSATLAQPYQYWLEERDVDGTATLYGPVSPAAITALRLTQLSTPTPAPRLPWLLGIAALGLLAVWRSRR